MSESGVIEAKKLLEFVFSMANSFKISLADGKFDWYDANNFVDPLKKIAPAVETILTTESDEDQAEILNDIENLTVEEVVELAKYSMTELGLGGNIDVAEDVDAAVEKVNDAIALGKSLLYNHVFLYLIKIINSN